MDELLSSKELAGRLKRSPSYVYAMRRQGFAMIAGRTTLRAAIFWLRRNQFPRAAHGRTNTHTNGKVTR